MKTITRVYANGDRFIIKLSDKDAEMEVNFNLKYRPGCAIFVDSECVQRGYLTVDKCDAISKELNKP